MKKIDLKTLNGESLELEDVFDGVSGGSHEKQASSYAAPRKNVHRMLNHIPRSEEALPHSLTIGAGVLCNLPRVVKFFQGESACRYTIIGGVHRHEERIVAVDLFLTSHNMTYADKWSNYPVTDPEILKALGSDDPLLIDTRVVLTVPNSTDHFIPYADQRRKGDLPEEEWPDVLARLSQTLMHGVTEYHNAYKGINNPENVREGFTIPIPFRAVCSGNWSPFLPGGDFARVDSEILSTREIEHLAAYANSFMHMQKGERRMGRSYNFQLPPSNQWGDMPQTAAMHWRADGKLNGYPAPFPEKSN